MIESRQPDLDEWRSRLKTGDRAVDRAGIYLWAVTLGRRWPRTSWQDPNDVIWDAWRDPFGDDPEPRYVIRHSSELEPLPYPGMTGSTWTVPLPRRRRRRRRPATARA